MSSGGSYLNMEKEKNCDQSRRNLLKKSYTAPAMVALGSMSFSVEAKAGWFWGTKKDTGSSSGGSSLSGGSTCQVCFCSPCIC